MGMFVSGKVAITATGVTDEKEVSADTDVIWIKPKMDFGTRQRVQGAATRVALAQQTKAQRKAAKKAAKKAQMDFDVGAYQIALLTFNILSWAGPSFAGIPCLPQNIERLDLDEPLVAMVLKEIGERNAPANADDDEDDEDDEVDDPNVLQLTPIAASSTRARS